ncbi:MAG: hypothetical protein KF729_34665 [Sandaracinaceae bacterium]|nr:hypothetical protein [Sandaracinaceae bacterium]
MSMKHTLLSFSIALGLFGSGCANRALCMERCEAQLAEACAISSNCEGICDAYERQAAGSGCVAEYDATQRCILDGDVCMTDRCNAETSAAAACLVAFCDANPGHEVCPSRP